MYFEYIRKARKKPKCLISFLRLPRNIIRSAYDGRPRSSFIYGTDQSRPSFQGSLGGQGYQDTFMAIYLTSSSPSILLDSFKKEIKQRGIVTWMEKDGFFTHDVDQWRYKAWFKPTVTSGHLVFNIVKTTGVNVTSVVYAIYHGRLIESMLTHFDKSFTNAQATALPTSEDVVQ